MFEQEACEACKSFAETAGALFKDNAPEAVETVQENNPPAPTLATILANKSTD